MAKITRRNFVQASGVAGAASLIGFPKLALAAKKKVVIVGGGIGGATAAKYIRMADSSIDVTLIEANKNYHTCFMSNEVLGGHRSIDKIRFGYDGLKAHGVKVVNDMVTGIDAGSRKVMTQNSGSFSYDRAIVSPGVDFKFEKIEGHSAQVAESIPHAWKAGPQTATLRKQLEGMRNGGTVVICPPNNPFRCPPGPYERASLIADYLKKNKPKSKIIIMDPKGKFSKMGLFTQAWKRLYGYETSNSMIEWHGKQEEAGIAAVDPGSRTITTNFGDKVKADVLNIIPDQRAGKIAMVAGLNKGDWCPVDKGTFESDLQDNIHVLGDASIATKMPKSGYSANSQAKVCAAAVVALLNGQQPGTPSYVNTCYSIAGEDYGFSVAAVYRLGQHEGKQRINPVKGAGGLTPMDASDEHLRREVGYAHSWFNNITHDVFG